MNNSDSGSNKAAIKITRIITHIRFHTDEGYGMWVLKKEGGKMFGGIETAKVCFVDANPELSDDKYDAAGILPVGVGRGRFDEHENPERKHESATSLILQFLKIESGAIYRLGREIHWCDKNRGVSNTQMAEIVKSAHRVTKNGGSVLNWLNQTFDMIHEQLSLHYEKAENEVSALAFFDQMEKAGWFKEEFIKKYLKKRLTESELRTKAFLKDPSVEKTAYTEIDFVVRAMQRIGKTTDEIYAWLTLVLGWMEKDQTFFIQALAECDNEMNRYSIRTDGRSLHACLLETDNPMALRAANYKRQDLIIIRKSTGHVQIFLNHKIGQNLDIVISIIRWLESPVKGRELIDFDSLKAPGALAGSEHWVYQPEKSVIFNGSDTRPGITPTQISSKMLREISLYSFCRYGIREWKKLKKIKDSAPPEQEPVAETPPEAAPTAPQS